MKELILTSDAIQSIPCGPFEILYIPAEFKFSQETALISLSDLEQNHAAQIKAKMRKEEYIRSRWLFKNNFRPGIPLLSSEQGAPLWPEDLAGSVTHKEGHVMMCCLAKNKWVSLGIDLEKVAKMKMEFEPRICNDNEMVINNSILAKDNITKSQLLSLIFSFKEAVFKSHFPLGNTAFYFHDAEILSFDIERQQIEAKVLIDTSPLTKKGHIVIGHYRFIRTGSDSMVITATGEKA